MGVRARDGGRLLVGDKEMEAASKCDPFAVFISIDDDADKGRARFLSCILLLQSLKSHMRKEVLCLEANAHYERG